MEVTSRNELVLLSSILEDSTLPAEKVLEKLIQVTESNNKPGSSHRGADVDRFHAIRSTFLALTADQRTLYASSIAETICFPMLRGQQSRVQEREEVDDETARASVVLARLFCSVAEYCSDALLSSLFTSLLETSCWAEHGTSIVCFLHHSLTHGPTMTRLERIDHLVDQLFTCLLSVLKSAERALCYHVSNLVLPSLLVDKSRAGRLWDFVCRVWDNQVVVEMESRDLVLTLLCCLINAFIPNVNTDLTDAPALSNDCFDIRGEKFFWDVVQTGLSSSDDPLARKRCLFLLDRVVRSLSGGDKSVASPGSVFWWEREKERELTEVWQDVRLLLETLEEKQVHIVKPVLQHHLKQTIAASRVSHGTGGHTLLHVSWLMVVMRRVFVHDAKTIIRIGLRECLSMQLDKSSFLHQDHWKLLLDPLLTVLCETFVYVREDPGAATPPMVSLLVDFMAQFTTGLPDHQKSLFVTLVLSGCLHRNMSDVPLLYMTYTLSRLPSSGGAAPLINTDGLAVIRKLLLTNQLSSHPKQKMAILSFLLSAIGRLCDMTISYSEILVTLGCFYSNSCLVLGTSAWEQACQWVVGVVRRQEDASSLYRFLQDNISKLLTGVEKSCVPSYLGALLLLGADAEYKGETRVLCSEEGGLVLSDTLSLLLGPVAETLAGARERAYMSPEVVRGAVELLSSILQLLLSTQQLVDIDARGDKGISRVLYTCLKSWLPDIFTFFHESLLSGASHIHYSTLPSSTLDHVQLFSSAVDSLYQFMSKLGCCDISFDELVDTAIEQLLSCVEGKKMVPITVQLHGSVTLLQWICSLCDGCSTVPLAPHTLGSLLTKLAKLPANLTITKPSSKESDSRVEWGSAITHCLHGYWSCIHYALSRLHSDSVVVLENNGLVPVGTRCICELVSVCMDQLDIAGHGLATPLYCISILVPQLLQEEGWLDVLVSCVTTAWRLVLELKGDLKPFTAAMKAFLSVVFHPDLLLSSGDHVYDMLVKCSDDIYELGEIKTGVVNILVEYLCSLWQSLLTSTDTPCQAVVDSLCRYDSVIFRACVFGPVFKKNLRISANVDQFIGSLGDGCSANQIIWSDVSDGDLGVRVRMLSFLVEIASSSPHTVAGFIQQLVEKVTQQLVSLTTSKPHYFISTQTHRVRQRLMQVLLLLQQWLDKECGYSVVMVMLECLESDQQLSVRFLMEWLSILLMCRHTHLLESLLLPQLKMDSGRRLSRLCSIITIAMLTGESLLDMDKLASYYTEVLPAVFQWCLCHQFIARVYAAGAVLRMWRTCERLGLHHTHPQIASLGQYISFIEQYSDVTRSKKLESNVLFSLTTPTTDISIQAIFQLIPALTGMMEEELVGVEQFVAPLWARPHPPIALYCRNERLLKAFESLGSSDEGSDNIEKFRVDEQPAGADVQKKITPWSSAAEVERELFPNMSTTFSVSDEVGKRSKLILVASLLNKTSNLGGLCRTCEIFGVSEFALSSTTVLEDKHFQSLSVTSEKWQKITEVKPAYLKQYLQQLKERGYTLVGVEQTAHSKCLSNYPLPLHTALILGSEREGIPVELIHMLDVCVEIPQVGIIRSLNVHVSGALVIWEYSKQHMVKQQ